jgi:hypothetical protein
MSLQSKKVAILETRLGRQLVELVEGRGAVAFHAPALAELPDLDPDAIAALVRSLEERPAKLAVFQTASAPAPSLLQPILSSSQRKFSPSSSR